MRGAAEGTQAWATSAVLVAEAPAGPASHVVGSHLQTLCPEKKSSGNSSTSLKSLSPEEGKTFNLYKPEGRNRSDHWIDVA